MPQPLASLDGDEPPEQTPDMSHWQFPSEHTVVLDEEWWLAEEGDRFPPEVRARLEVNHRRPITLAAALAAPTGEAWRKVPTTILLGEIDGRVSRPLRQWAQRHFNDVRLIDCDHFILWHRPDTVVQTVLELLKTADASSLDHP